MWLKILIDREKINYVKKNVQRIYLICVVINTRSYNINQYFGFSRNAKLEFKCIKNKILLSKNCYMWLNYFLTICNFIMLAWFTSLHSKNTTSMCLESILLPSPTFYCCVSSFLSLLRWNIGRSLLAVPLASNRYTMCMRSSAMHSSSLCLFLFPLRRRVELLTQQCSQTPSPVSLNI